VLRRRMTMWRSTFREINRLCAWAADISRIIIIIIVVVRWLFPMNLPWNLIALWSTTYHAVTVVPSLIGVICFRQMNTIIVFIVIDGTVKLNWIPLWKIRLVVYARCVNELRAIAICGAMRSLRTISVGVRYMIW